MKKIAILLTVHNRKVKTLNCLQKLFNQTLSSEYRFDVYVTIDGCIDGTEEAIKNSYPSVTLIHGDGSLFWNKGMRVAWECANSTNKYDYFIWLNDDTELFIDAIQKLVDSSQTLVNNSIIVGSTCATENRDNITYGGRIHKMGIVEPTNQLKECDFFNGNIVLIPFSVFLKVGYNDNCFSHALGDFDYGLRATKLKVKIYVAPSVLGICDTHESLPTWCNPQKSFVTRWKHFRTPLGHNPEEYFIFEKRHFGITSAIFHYITNHLRVLFPRIWT